MTLFTARMLVLTPSARPSQQNRLAWLPGFLYGDPFRVS